MVKAASRTEKIPPYLFARIDKKKEEARKKGIDLIDLSIGDPDIATPRNIIEAMNKAVADPKNHRYPSYEGMFEFRKAVADWYHVRFNVDLNPANEVVTLIGSKRGSPICPGHTWKAVMRSLFRRRATLYTRSPLSLPAAHHT